MKALTLKTFLLLALSCLWFKVVAQDVGFTYQAVALDETKAEGFGRDSRGEILVNKDLNVRFSILEGSENGPLKYQETHATSTDIFGIFRAIVGRGYVITNNRIRDLNWGQVPYFLQVEVDLGKGYQFMGVEELLGSPYALNTLNQELELNGNELSITQGNSVDLSKYLDDTRLTEEEVDAMVSNNGYLTEASGAFTTTDHVTSNDPGDYTNDDFVFGSDHLNDDGDTNHWKRMFFDKSKGAFRAGMVQGNSWDEDNVGNYSFATGVNSTAYGSSSVAIGSNAGAHGVDAISIGSSSLAFGDNSLAMSTARSYSLGSIAIGEQSESQGVYSTAIGFYARSNADYSFAFGQYLEANAPGEVVIGMNNTNNSSIDRLFVIGNGTHFSQNRSDALVMLKNGNTTLHGNFTIDADNVGGPGTPYTLPGQDGNYGQVMVTDGNGTLSWGNATGTGAFSTTNHVTSNAPGDYAIDDFVFGSPQLDNDGNSSHFNRMFFDKYKGAFRAGGVNGGDQWDYTNVGAFSFAAGAGPIAYGSYSIAMGLNARAMSNSALALGEQAFANELNSAAIGTSLNSNGVNSITIGTGLESNAYAQTTIGLFNAYNVPLNGGGYNPEDRLFVIGKGIDELNRSDALVMLKNGNTTLHGNLTIDADNVGGPGTPYTLPGQDGNYGQIMVTDGNGTLSWGNATGTGAFSTTNHVTSNAPGDYTNDDFVFGSPQLDNDGNPSHFNRMFFDKNTGAFRAGRDNTGRWNNINIGNYSISLGNNSMASGGGSVAIGDNSFSTGIGSITIGENSTASGNGSIALGTGCSSEEWNALAFGFDSHSHGETSVSIGLGLLSNSLSEFSIGRYNTNSPGNSNTLISTDRLFTIGNGNSDTDRSDALTMLKNGNTTLHGNLTIDADNVTGPGTPYTLPGQDGTNGQVMVTNGSGDLTWTTLAGGGVAQDLQLNTTTNILNITDNAAATDIDLSPYVNVFETTNHVTSNSPGDISNDDFVFGSSVLNILDGAQQTRMYFDKSKGAFRAGFTTGQQWDDNYVGMHSIAFGVSSIASGSASFAHGYLAQATGNGSIALGYGPIASAGNSVSIGTNTNASGNYSIAIGTGSSAHSNHSIAIGYNNSAFHNYAFAAGRETTASGNTSFSIGFQTVASGYGSTSMGTFTNASGYVSLAAGSQTEASGQYSAALGHYTVAESLNEFTIGRYNTIDPLASPNTIIETNRVFTIGNGVDDINRSDALIMLKNGNTTLHGNLTIDADNVGGADGYTLPGQNGSSGQVMMTNVTGDVAWVDLMDVPATSDKRLKKDITPVENSLAKVLDLKGVNFYWNEKSGRDTTDLKTGFIAQQVEAIIPELVTTDANGFKQVNYIEVIPYLVEAIKELKKENEELKRVVQEKDKKEEILIDQLAGRLKLLEKLLNADNSALTAQH